MTFWFESRGDWSSTEDFLRRARDAQIYSALSGWGQQGVNALASATPLDTGWTASSWYYEVRKTGRGWSVEWHNSNQNQGFVVAVGLQYGHGTGTGGWVQGRDYINPAIRPVMDQIVEGIWREVTR